MKDDLYFVSGPSAVASEIRKFDWATTPLGPLKDWPTPLKTAIQMMLASHFPQAIVWGASYTTLFNDAFRPILGGKRECMGKPFNVIWAEAWSSIGAIAAKAYAGEATFIENFPLVIDRSGIPEQCYFTFCYSPIMDEDGSIGGLLDTVIETTAVVEAEKSAAIVNAELAHRIKNTFSIVQAVAGQTFKTIGSREEVQTFSRRLSALANAHEVLLLGESSSGPLKRVIDGVAGALSVGHRISMNGPAVMVGPKGALSTSLLVHELMTNAMKYGALSGEGGQVAIRWSIEAGPEGPLLILQWTESGGPPVATPEKTGFGSKLIRMGLMGRGDVEMEFQPQGFRAKMTAPLDRFQGEGRLYGDAAG